MIRNTFSIGNLTDSQKKAIVILLFKGGDCQLLSSWRPISLICVDTKVMSKMIANRMKPLMNKCISVEQYCNNGKTITECNNVTRDMIYYICEKNETGALVNIDLMKAFDSIDHSFLFAILEKMGFSKAFISIIQLFYKDIFSVCLVNGHQSNPFSIRRGVRQGCPLSMLLYVISQEPLYRAFKSTQHIQPFQLPCRETKLLGYADDTTLFVNSDYSIEYIFKILKDFGMASGVIVNTNKSRILGFGNWKNREDWPVSDLRTEKSEIEILGIIFSRDINQAIDLSWGRIIQKINIMTRLLSCSRLTLYQRATVINSLVLARVWYNAHTYPLPIKYSKLIHKEIFEYLWQSKSNPIKRDVVHQETINGGLGICNILIKSECILTSTFLKHFLVSEENGSLIKYFCSIRINPIFNIRILPNNVAYICPWYLNNVVINVRKCYHLKHFPNIKTSDMYRFMLPECEPTVITRHNLQWKKIWRHLTFKFIDLQERDIIFKFLHEILPNKSRLYQIRKANSPLCRICNVSEDNIHMFGKCKIIKNILHYFKNILNEMCGIVNMNIKEILYLDIKIKNKKNVNTAILLISQYISTIWYNRDKSMSLEPNLYKVNIIKHHKFLKLVLKERMNQIFTEKYCRLDYHM